MRRGVHFLQLADRDVGVDLRGLQTGVPELFLDVTDVRAVFEHEHRAGVAEQVARTGFGKAGAGDVTRHQSREVTHRQQRALFGDEQRLSRDPGEASAEPG